MDPEVPRNQHTFVQSTIIEVLSAAVCQLVGIDPVDPSTPCLDINPVTHKLGYATSNIGEDGKPKVGGMLGATSNMIAVLYTPTVGTSAYVSYLGDNFGIVKTAHAATGSEGFNALKPVIELWKLMLDIAYILLVFAFILIGLGIMLRVRIDPRTVMTIQNQIPRVIICILLITFSYAIAAFLIDMMWVTTYVGINAITQRAEFNPPASGDNPPKRLSQKATETLLETPLVFVSQVFHTKGGGFANVANNGIIHLTSEVAHGAGLVVEGIIKDLLGVNEGDGCFKINHFGPIPTSLPKVNIGACMANFIGFLFRIAILLVILIVLLVALFRIWFTLLKAYVFILIYVITAPIWIVMGLLPGRPLGFEKWLRALFANVAVFPMTVLLLVLARVFMDVFKNADPTQSFVPPLVGNPNLKGFGAFLAFGVILMAPTFLNVLRDALKTPGTKHGAAIAAGIAAGAAAPRALSGATWNRLTRKHNYQTGEEAGAFRKWAVGNPNVGADGKVDKSAMNKFAQLRYRLLNPLLEGVKPGEKK